MGSLTELVAAESGQVNQWVHHLTFTMLVCISRRQSVGPGQWRGQRRQRQTGETARACAG